MEFGWHTPDTIAMLKLLFAFGTCQRVNMGAAPNNCERKKQWGLPVAAISDQICSVENIKSYS